MLFMMWFSNFTGPILLGLAGPYKNQVWVYVRGLIISASRVFKKILGQSVLFMMGFSNFTGSILLGLAHTENQV